MVKIKLSISGVFGKKVLDRNTTINLGENPSVQDVFNQINTQFYINLTGNCIEERAIVCVWNDEIVQVDDLAKIVHEGDSFAILQPIAGG